MRPVCDSPSAPLLFRTVPFVTKVLGSIAEVPRPAWDGLLDDRASPFVTFGWLEALEHSGCVGDDAGWTPQHLTLWRDGRLVAAAPAYLTHDGDGDFARDWDLAEAARSVGARYYPKLALTVPFTPCTGRRVLVAPGEDRPAATRALAALAREVAAERGCGTFQVLFPDHDDADRLEAAGLARRVSFQYHWRNAGYRDFGDFLARFSSKRRTMIKREVTAPARQGIALRTVRGPELAADAEGWAVAVDGLHRATVDKLAWGRRWVNLAFYHRLLANLPDRVEVVEARRAGRLVAGAFNVSSPTHLYGRYWGCLEEHPFLHFNVCLYHSVDDCIRRGLAVFEGGAGGEHKLYRGFEPEETYSVHGFIHPRLEAAMRGLLAQETAQRRRQVAHWREAASILKPLSAEEEASA